MEWKEADNTLKGNFSKIGRKNLEIEGIRRIFLEVLKVTYLSRLTKDFKPKN